MMLTKKVVSIALACAVVAGVGSTTVYAHCRRGVTNYSLCTVEDCNTLGNHWHDGVCYSGHTLNDGHDYHQVCSVANCTLTTTHVHNGVTYMGHHTEDGHAGGCYGYGYGGGHHRGRHH